MTPRTWPVSRDAAVVAIEATGTADEGSLISWAIWSADSVRYLQAVEMDATTPDPLGHARHVVDVAHVRSATSAAVTAIDLCAAILGRRIWGPSPNGHEAAVTTFVRPRHQQNYARLSAGGRVWIDGVLSDPDYLELKAIRNPMTHAYWKNRKMWVPTPAGSRTGFITARGELAPSEMIALAVQVAERHLDVFLAGVIAGTLP